MKPKSWLKAALALLWLTGVACRKQCDCADLVIDYSDRPVGELVAGLRIEQSFVANHDRLSAVALKMATYAGRASHCRVTFNLRREGSPDVVVHQAFPCAAIVDNAWLRFHFDPLEGTKGRRFVFTIESPNGRPGKAATIWMASAPGIYPDGALLVNGIPTPGALRFTTFHE